MYSKILGKFFVREWLFSTVGWRRTLASKVPEHQILGAWEGRLRRESFKTCLGFYFPIPDIWYWLCGELGHRINVSIPVWHFSCSCTTKASLVEALQLSHTDACLHSIIICVDNCMRSI